MKNRLELIELTAKDARKFFFTSEAFSTLHLPNYINFEPIINHIKSIDKSGKNKKAIQQFIDEIRKSRPQESEGVNLEILINKDGPLSYRKISIPNPFIYYFLCKTITEEENWKLIQERFKLFSSTSEKIHVASIPTLKSNKDKTLASASISRWWNELEQQSIRNSLRYKLYIQTDIANCYPSIYVHSISWALHTREECKRSLPGNKKDRLKNLGGQIEEYILGMQCGETVGISLGSIVFDLIAELVLGYIDLLLYEKIKDYDDVEILRFRDDYRIFSNNENIANLVLINLSDILRKFKLNLNPAKTKLNTNIAISSIKSDKLDRINNPFHKSNLQELLTKILIFSEKHPNSGTIAKTLSKTLKKLEKNKIRPKNKEKINTLIAIATQIALKNPKYFHICISIISQLLSTTKNSSDKISTYNLIKLKIQPLKNIDYLEIWMQRLALGINIEDQDFTNKLSRLLFIEREDKRTIAWNFDWVRDKPLKGLPLSEVFSLKAIQNLPACIASEEVSIFDSY